MNLCSKLIDKLHLLLMTLWDLLHEKAKFHWYSKLQASVSTI